MDKDKDVKDKEDKEDLDKQLQDKLKALEEKEKALKEREGKVSSFFDKMKSFFAKSDDKADKKGKEEDDEEGEEEGTKKKKKKVSVDQDLSKKELKKLKQEVENLKSEKAFNDLCKKFKIEKEQHKRYFNFLLAEKEAQKEDSLDDKEVNEIGKTVIEMFKIGEKETKEDKKEKSSVSVKGQKAIDGVTKETITLEEFNKMGLMELNDLYKKNKGLYETMKKMQEKQDGWVTMSG